MEEHKTKASKVLKCTILIIFIFALLWVMSQLFFKNEVDNVVDYIKSVVVGDGAYDAEKYKNLKVIYPDLHAIYDPRLTDPSTRQRLVNIYEPLVRFDEFYNIESALALSWGVIDQYTWEFNLRPNVLFHDGTQFTAEDVAYTLEINMDKEVTGSDFYNSIEIVDVRDDLTLRIETLYPDPLLLQKLALMLIVSSENADLSDMNGTGSYMVTDFSEKELNVSRFENYWGKKAVYETVNLLAIPDKTERTYALIDGEAEFLTFVSFDAAEFVQQSGYVIEGIPSLEVQSLLFNMESDVLKDTEERKIISIALNKDNLIEEVGGYARNVNQFVSNGVFGFSPGIKDIGFDIEKAVEMAEEIGLSGNTVQLHLPIGLTVLGDFIRESLSEIGVNVIVSYLEIDRLIESFEQKKADVYFLGFKSELGDAGEFFNSVVHSHGDFSYFGYDRVDIDFMIDSAAVEFDDLKRRDLLQEIMSIVVEEDIIGVPLFEYETIYGYESGIEFTPRIDGLVYFNDIKK